MKKFKQTAKTILIFILCSATCFLSIGCGEDLTFEDGEYTAEMVAQPAGFSSYETNFKVKIEKQELIIYDVNWGSFSKEKISKEKWVFNNFKAYNDFNINTLYKVKYSLKTKNSTVEKSTCCFHLIVIDGVKYLLLEGGNSNGTSIAKVWELKRTC